MSRLTRRGATSATTLLWVALSLVGFSVLAVWTVQSQAGPIQADIERRARDAVSGAPGLDLRVEADGRDVFVHGRVGNERDHQAVIARLMDVDGIRQIDDALQVVPGLRTMPAPQSEAWGDAVPSGEPEAPSAPGAPAGDAWGTNRPPAAITKPVTGSPEAPSHVTPGSRARVRTPLAPSPRREGAMRAQEQIVFARGSTVLGDEGRAAVQAMARTAGQGGTVHVYGHADDGGSEWSNHDLSLDRAHAVARALRSAGAPSVRAHGAGDQYPLGPAGSLRNRRAEIAFRASRP